MKKQYEAPSARVVLLEDIVSTSADPYAEDILWIEL